MPYESGHRWDKTDYFGASLAARADSLVPHGYFPVRCSYQGTNIFFVRIEDREQFADVPTRWPISIGRLITLRRSRRDIPRRPGPFSRWSDSRVDLTNGTGIRPAMRPDWRRCSSLKYSRYSRLSRLPLGRLAALGARPHL